MMMDISSYINQFLFGYYPYIALVVFFVGSLVRFDREQYTWKSDSSELLHRGQLRWGSNLFHIGVLGIFFGHLGGLFTPLWVWHAIGLTVPAKQMVAIVGGGIAGVMCFAGLVMLLHRRLSDPRIRINSKPMDILVLVLLLAQVSLGLLSITVSWAHLDGAEMLRLMDWAQRIVTFRVGAAELIAPVPLIFKLHLALGLTVFLIFPFTRLVHVWSGLATVYYVMRPYQVVRQR
jgi:nitrate reductase gamma subunit